jgi:hypothetical protein
VLSIEVVIVKFACPDGAVLVLLAYKISFSVVSVFPVGGFFKPPALRILPVQPV